MSCWPSHHSSFAADRSSLNRAVRRKYGIPDDSKEPFNVAYAKAEKKKREERLRQTQNQAASRLLDKQESAPQSPNYQRTPAQTTPQHRIAPASRMSFTC